MTQTFWVFPEISVRETKRRKARHVGANRKYDHWAMLLDRMAGMTWAEIERKHGVRGNWSKPGAVAHLLTVHSTAIRRLKPHEVALIFRKDAA